MTNVVQLKQMIRLYFGQNLRGAEHASEDYAPQLMTPGNEIDDGLIANLTHYLKEIRADKIGVTVEDVLSDDPEDIPVRDTILAQLKRDVAVDDMLGQFASFDRAKAEECAHLIDDLPTRQQTALLREIWQRVKDADPPTHENRTAVFMRDVRYLGEMMPALERRNEMYREAMDAYTATPQGKARKSAVEQFNRVYDTKASLENAGLNADSPQWQQLHAQLEGLQSRIELHSSERPHAPDAAVMLRDARPTTEARVIEQLPGMQEAKVELGAIMKSLNTQLGDIARTGMMGFGKTRSVGIGA